MGQALSECMGDFGAAHGSAAAYDRVGRRAPPRVGAPPPGSGSSASSGNVTTPETRECARGSNNPTSSDPPEVLHSQFRSHSRSNSIGNGIGIGADVELSVRAMMRTPSAGNLRQRGMLLSEKRGFIMDKFEHVPSTQSQVHAKWKRNCGPCALTNISKDAAVVAPPPPLIPDASAVYDLIDDDEEVCPTCLESYTDDNPKIAPTCGHSFHLQCLCAWNERSGSRFCPICAKVLVFDDVETLLVS